MITQEHVEIVIKVVLEIDTDMVEYGVHGGCEDPDEIAEKAIGNAVEDMEAKILPIAGVKVMSNYIGQYNLNGKTIDI